MITRENYEIYIIDYLDGNLSVEDQKALMHFLDQNIDLKEEFDLMKDFQMPEANESFQDKQSLKKKIEEQNVDRANIDEWCIAAIENDLADKDKQKFESIINEREEFQQIYALYKQTKLYPEKTPYPEFRPWRLPDFNLTPKAEDVDFWVIADLENDLSPEQKHSWLKYKSNISNIEDVESSYEKIKLHPESIIYPNKIELKHKKSRIGYLYSIGGVAAAAAAFYLFLNIANFKQNTYKRFNDQMAKIEHSDKQDKYVPEATIIHPALMDQVAYAIKNYHERNNAQKPNVHKANISSITNKAPKYGAIASIDLIKKREASIDISNQNDIPTEQPTEVITADNLMGDYMDENDQNKINTNRNKLTLFKVAQIGVTALNSKVGTDMKLEAKYNEKGEKKRVKFSNRLFSVTKTINK